MAAARREPCQLVLAIEAGDAAIERFGAIVPSVRPACIVIEPGAGRGFEPACVRPLVVLGQRAGIAVLIADDAAFARELRADGVHLGARDDAPGALRSARAALSAGAIIGADAGFSRHDAMTLGELGADYVAFARPAEADPAEGLRRQRELVAWWAEIFEPPCMATDVPDLDSAVVLAEAGADFVTLRLGLGRAVAETLAEVRTWADTIARAAALGEGA